MVKCIHLIFYLIFFSLASTLVQGEENQENEIVLLAILARNKAHVLPTYLKCIEKLDYDKKLITVYINTNDNIDNTAEILEGWIKKNKDQYRSVIYDNYHIIGNQQARPHEWPPQRVKILGEIRNKSLQKAKESKSDYYFVVDCDNFIIPSTLKYLISKKKPIIAPMLVSIPDKLDYYSNFFYDVKPNGYYLTHPNFFKISTYEMIGTFKVPVVHCTYLIDSQYIDKLNYVDESKDHEFIVFSRIARNNNVDQYICNEQEFGVQLHFIIDLTLEEEQKRFQKINFRIREK